MATMAQDFANARLVATPLIAIETPDPAATMRTLTESADPGTPVLRWDLARGIVGVNADGESAALLACNGVEPATITNATEALLIAANVPAAGYPIVFILSAHRILAEPSVTQAIWNLRDVYKSDGRTLVLLAPNIQLPAELAQDVLILTDPLPTGETLGQVARALFDAAGYPEPDDSQIERAIDATVGLAQFPAEQALAMSLRRSLQGLDYANLWERKRRAVEQTKGLSIYRGPETFADIAGYSNLITFYRQVFAGRSAPRVQVFIDEIEKSIGSSGDTSGVSQSMLGTLLTDMQDRGATGLILVGAPGTGKSAMAKAAGGEAGIPTIQFDLSGMKASLVGESETNIRQALAVVNAVGQGRVLFVATCNAIASLPPELRRRFNFGTFYMEMPDATERADIWALYRARFEIPEGDPLPNDEGWTGAEIRQCCDIAWRFGSTLAYAASYVVPVSIAARDSIERLRTEAHGKYISASYPGYYDKARDTKPSNGRLVRA